MPTAAKKRVLFRLVVLTAVAMLLATVSVLALRHNTSAAISGWKAGNIMDDAVMANKSTMSVSKIQSFLNSKVPTCDTNGQQLSEYGGPDLNKDGKVQRWEWGKANYNQTTFPCLRNYKDPSTGLSSAQTIYNASQKYNINPQVLIVLLQKEQGLVQDTWPLSIQYKTATGYGCPDTAPCDSDYYGLTNQINWAATMFHAILTNNPNWYTPYVLGKNYIQYNPSASCGGSTVNIENRATQALYNYTPYQPNQAALDAGWGTASCGAYGNRNFYLYFTGWFGSTHYTVKGSIGTYYNSADVAATLGEPVENESPTVNGGWKQCFENGCIVGSRDTGYWMVKGSIGTYYWSADGPSGRMDLPLSSEVKVGDSIYYQKYQGGYVVGQHTTGYWSVKGTIGKVYSPANDTSTLGVPLKDESNMGNGGWKQQFTNGYISGSSDSGYWKTTNPIQTKWQQLGSVTGKLGLPVGAAKELSAGVWRQPYQRGVILSNGGSYWSVDGSIYPTYKSLGEQASDLGLPVSDEQSDGSGVWHQQYQNGYIIGEKGHYYESRGVIRDYWISLDTWNGKLGMVIGPIQTDASGTLWQHFTGGVIIVNPKNNQAWESSGSIRKVWASLGYQNGQMGYPTGPEKYSNGIWSQAYEHGVIETKSGAKYQVIYNP